MFLLLTITILNLITAFGHEISRPIKLFLLRPTKNEVDIKAEIQLLRSQLNKISVRDQYIEYVKTERKIGALEQVLTKIKLRNSTRTMIINFATGYVFQAVLSFILFLITIWNRYTPVIVFDDKFNFSPFGGLISFPTGEHNAISVPFWIFVSNFSLRSIANSIRSRNIF